MSKWKPRGRKLTKPGEYERKFIGQETPKVLRMNTRLGYGKFVGFKFSVVLKNDVRYAKWFATIGWKGEVDDEIKQLLKLK